MKSIKEGIEIQFKKISDSRDILLDEITSSFIEKRIKLDELEKKLKNELDIKVTELKDELEKYYIKSSDIISSCERIFKAIQYYEKNIDNNNYIKVLCYISKINKINIEAKNFIKSPFKNMQISFNNNNLDYKYYYINGIPIPKDINIEQIDNKLYISWNIDNLYLDIKNIKYLITLRDDKTESKYESAKTNFIIQGYKLNTDYKIIINAIVDDINGDCNEIKKFGTYMPANINPFTNLFKDVNFN